MKVFKITYRGKNINGNWITKYSLRYGNTEDEVVAQIGVDHKHIKSVEFLGYKKGTRPKPLDK